MGETGVIPLAITPIHPLRKFALPIPVSLEFVFLKEESLSSGDTAKLPLNCKLKLLSRYFGLLVPKNSRQEDGFPFWQRSLILIRRRV